MTTEQIGNKTVQVDESGTAVGKPIPLYTESQQRELRKCLLDLQKATIHYLDKGSGRVELVLALARSQLVLDKRT